MVALDGQAIFAAVVVVLIVIAILLIILVYRNQRTDLEGSSILTNEPCTAPPSTPINLSATNPQGDLIVLEWTPTASTEGYVAQISTVPNFGDGDVLATRNVSSNAAGFANISLGATYYFRVKATNSCGDSAWSAQINFRLEFVYPDTFRIANKISPNYNVCDDHDNIFAAAQTDQTRYSRFCNNVNGNYYAEPSDKTIRQASRPNRCLTRVAGGFVWNNVCNGTDSQKWSYDSTDNTLCSATNFQDGCLNTTAAVADEEPGKHGPKNLDPNSTWIFTEV